jgi:hypothetical protein
MQLFGRKLPKCQHYLALKCQLLQLLEMEMENDE